MPPAARRNAQAARARLRAGGAGRSACRTRASSRRHILPNVMHLVLIAIVLDFSGLVLAEAVLSYVGVGVDPTMISFGTMINGARLEMAREPMVWWRWRGIRLHVHAGAGRQPVCRRACAMPSIRAWGGGDESRCSRFAISSLKSARQRAGRRRRRSSVAAGETFALLGESGCGKSMTALSLMRLLPDGGRIVSGGVRLGRNRCAGPARARHARACAAGRWR